MSLKDRWPTWGSSGEQPLDGTQYETGDNVAAATLNYLWYQIKNTVGDIEDKLNNKADSPHGNEAHSSTFAVDGDAQPPESHGNASHSQTFAVDGDAQPPETHDNSAHSETYLTSGDVDGAPNPHDNSAHSPNFLKQSNYNPQTDTSYDTFSGSHDDLTNVGASDHHSRYTDSEAAAAAPVSDVNGQTGSVTIDTSGSGHERYTDQEARDAVAAIYGNSSLTEVYLNTDKDSSDITNTDLAVGLPWDASDDTSVLQLENAGRYIEVQEAGTYMVDLTLVFKEDNREDTFTTKFEKLDGSNDLLYYESFESKVDLTEGTPYGGLGRTFLIDFDIGDSFNVTGDVLESVSLGSGQLLGKSSNRDHVGSRVRVKRIAI